MYNLNFDEPNYQNLKNKRPSSAKYPSLQRNQGKSQNETLEYENSNHLKPPILFKNNSKKNSKNSAGTLIQKSPKSKLTFDPEQLKQEQYILKQRVNDYQEENIKLKTKVAQLEKEILKMEKILEEIGTMNINSGNKQLMQKFADSNTLFQLKKQSKEYKNLLEQKEDELLKIKRNVKVTKIQELERDNQTFLDQVTKLTQLLTKQQKKIQDSKYLSMYCKEQEQKLTQQSNALNNIKKDYSTLAEIARELQKQNENYQNQIQKQQQSNEIPLLKKKIQSLLNQIKSFQSQQLVNKNLKSSKGQTENSNFQQQIQIKDKYIDQLEQIIFEQQKALNSDQQLQQSQHFQQIKQEYVNSQSRNASVIEKPEVNNIQFENQLQQELFSILNDIRYRLLFEKYPKQRVKFQYQKLSIDTLKSFPFLLTHQQAQFINQIFDTDIEAIMNAISDYQTFSLEEEQIHQNDLKPLLIDNKFNIEKYFNSMNKELVTEEDINKCFESLKIQISDREIEFLVYNSWKYVKQIDQETRIRSTINWNWIFQSIENESTVIQQSQKSKRPQSAGEGRVLSRQKHQIQQEVQIKNNQYQQDFNESIVEEQEYEKISIPQESIVESKVQKEEMSYPQEYDDEPGSMCKSQFEHTPQHPQEQQTAEQDKTYLSLGKSQNQFEQYEISEANYIF